jgi:hypothetical protein
VTVVAQCVKVSVKHGYVAGPIPAVTPRNCTITIKFADLTLADFGHSLIRH